jgi:hypothetical protein
MSPFANALAALDGELVEAESQFERSLGTLKESSEKRSAAKSPFTRSGHGGMASKSSGCQPQP